MKTFQVKRNVNAKTLRNVLNLRNCKKKKATMTEERGNRSQITRPRIKDSKDSKCEGKVLKTSEQRITRSNLLTGITCLLYQEKKQKELIAIISTLQ